MLGEQPTFEPCREVRAALSREVEKLDDKLRDLGESRQIVSSYLQSLEPARDTP
jgi:hypothetical protein